MASRSVAKTAKTLAEWTHRLGKVTKRNDAWNAVCVEVTDLEMDTYLNVYFNKTTEVWASEPSGKFRDGDIVMVKPLPEPQSINVQHFVHDVVFELGNVKDPITGRRCRGAQFSDSQKFFEELTEKRAKSVQE